MAERTEHPVVNMGMIKEKLKALNEEIEVWVNFKKLAQTTCPHDWKYIGHGHNEDLYECNICDSSKYE